MMKRLKTLLVLSVCSVFIVSGCTSKNNQSTNSYDYTAENEIISYQPINEDKRIITIGKYDSFDETPLEEALEEKFPDIDVVFVETLAGPNPVTYMKMQDEHNELTDISFCKVNIPDNDFLYDLAAENFLSKYNLSSLNALNINGKLFQIPTINSIHGIIYNKTLFQQHGWQVPQTIDEFYTLCEQISATGIRPFAVCTKYIEQLEWLGLGFSYDEIFANMEKQVQYNEFVQKNASSRNLLEPAFNVLKEFYHRGLIKDEDFSASITQYGYDLLNGDTAMLARNLDILSLPQEEGRDVELGFIGFPTNEAGNNWMEMISGTKISVAKKAMADDEKEKDI
ncbi:MAG: carbohydrate ABC transporter substrate-binding protein, partial [Erysipelotrichia bacterium]|nr:carbohydrate ABC transporter substrate-binding protein [Erysipelotrichia bacterium]